MTLYLRPVLAPTIWRLALMSFLNNVRSFFGMQAVHLKWYAPYGWQSAVRQDFSLRSIFGFGMAGVAFCICAFLIVSMNWYFPSAYCWTAIITALAGMTAHFSASNRDDRNGANGEYAIRENDVFMRHYKYGVYNGMWVPWYGTYWEELKIPFGSILDCQLVPAEAMKTSFSLLILHLSDETKVCPLPRSIDRNKVKQALNANGVEVKLRSAAPEYLTKKFNDKTAFITAAAGGVAGLVGMLVMLVGASLHDDGVPPPGGNLAERQPQPQRVEDPQIELIDIDPPPPQPRASRIQTGAVNPINNPWGNRPGGGPRPLAPPSAAPPSSIPKQPPGNMRPSFFNNDDAAAEGEVERAGDDVFSADPFGDK